jgi:hypothetical protein
MRVTTFAHIRVDPEIFPETVSVLYRFAERDTHLFTGPSYRIDAAPWEEIRRHLVITPMSLVEIEGNLRRGQSADLGFSYATFDM